MRAKTVSGHQTAMKLNSELQTDCSSWHVV